MNPNDKRVRDHHVKQHIVKYIRRGQPEPKLPLGMGNYRTGRDFDCDRMKFDKAIKAYWNRLFVGWNPFKNEGRGCWEIWQEPIRNKDLNDMEHWVMDLDRLDIDVAIMNLQRMDAWAYKKNVGRSIAEDMDRAEIDLEIANEKKEDEAIKYAVRHNKALFGKLKSYTQEGFNPFWFFADKKQGNGQI